METTITKGIGGWEAQTSLALDMPTRVDECKRSIRPVLEIRSYSRKGQIKITASVLWYGEGFKTFVVFQDFVRHLPPVACKRCTESAIRAAHDEALLQIETLKAAALTHYAKEDQAAA